MNPEVEMLEPRLCVNQSILLRRASRWPAGGGS
jgi:hypothetical protein